MQTQIGNNVAVYRGRKFDDAQSEVKRNFCVRDLAKKLDDKRFSVIGNFNKLGKILRKSSTISLHISDLLKSKKIKFGDRVFCVPAVNSETFWPVTMPSSWTSYQN